MVVKPGRTKLLTSWPGSKKEKKTGIQDLQVHVPSDLDLQIGPTCRGCTASRSTTMRALNTWTSRDTTALGQTLIYFSPSGRSPHYWLHLSCRQNWCLFTSLSIWLSWSCYSLSLLPWPCGLSIVLVYRLAKWNNWTWGQMMSFSILASN